jgi:hypothetical protein
VPGFYKNPASENDVFVFKDQPFSDDPIIGLLSQQKIDILGFVYYTLIKFC